jgi:hypothetical protein
MNTDGRRNRTALLGGSHFEAVGAVTLGGQDDDSAFSDGVAELAVEALLTTALAGSVNDMIGEVVLQKLHSGTQSVDGDLRTSDGFISGLATGNDTLAGHWCQRIHTKTRHIATVTDKAGLVKIQTITVIVYLIKINAVETNQLTHT